MNQQQRKLLCSILEEKRKQISKAITKHFIPSRHHVRVSPCYNKYIDQETMVRLPKNTIKLYKELVISQNQLDKTEECIRNKWKNLNKQLNVYYNEVDHKVVIANKKLDDFIENATIAIQFSENTEDVKGILQNLPDLKDLI